MKNVFLFTIFLLIPIAPISAHQDTPIQLKDGKLLGLPEEFQPAAFDLEKKLLIISGKNLPFPHSVQSLFPDDRSVDEFGIKDSKKGIPYELKFSASWYHGPSLLPPYLSIKITPKDRDFSASIMVDMESVVIHKANVLLKISDKRTEVIPVLIEEPTPPKSDLDDWRAIIGKWRAGETHIEITKDRIQTTESGAEVDYPNGRISPEEPGVMKLILPSGAEESFIYEVKGDIMELSFKRASGIGLARLGSKADQDARRRNKEAELDDAGHRATQAEPEWEDEEKPQLEVKERPR